MKKSKLLLPLTGVAMIGTIAPIVTLTSCGCSQNRDKQFLDTINALLDYTGDVVAPHKAITKLSGLGYDVLNHIFAVEGQEFAFDAKAKKFIIMNGDEVVYAPAGYTMADKGLVFKFVSEYTESFEYGQYLRDYAIVASSLEVNTSIDTGNNSDIKEIIYKTTANASKTVLLNTATEKLEITSSDTIYHMGKATNVIVEGIGTEKCKFHEGATVSCLKIASAELTAITDTTSADTSIAYLEATDDNVSSDKTTGEYVKFYTGEHTIGGIAKEKGEVTLVETAEKIEKCFAADEFFRLKNDIVLTTHKQVEIGMGGTLCIDLAGHTITDNDTDNTPCMVAVTGGTLTIMDSEGGGQIILNGRHILVNGSGTTEKSSVHFNGGKINFVSFAITAPFKVGNKTSTESAINSELVINGGSIAATQETGSKVEYGVIPYRNASVIINNCSIITNGPCIGGNGLHDVNTIKVVDGSFVSKLQECIYHPQQGKLEITGGMFDSKSKACIGVKGGEITISGGIFNSYGEYKETLEEGQGSGIDTDGSVIVMDICDHEYGEKISVKITNGTFASAESYIFRAIGLAGLSQEVQGTIEFVNGIYTYSIGDTLVSDNAKGHITINKNGGTWGPH